MSYAHDASVYDVNAYAVGADAFRVTFNSNADFVDLHPLANAGGVFSTSIDAQRYTRFGSNTEVSESATSGRPSYDIQRDGVSIWTVWLVPFAQFYDTENNLVQHAYDGTDGYPDRRRVVDLGV